MSEGTTRDNGNPAIDATLVKTTPEDLRSARSAFATFIQDSEIPREMMRIRDLNVVEQLRNRGVTRSVALALIEELVRLKVFVPGKTRCRFKVFVPSSGGPMTEEYFHSYRYLYFTRRRLRNYFTTLDRRTDCANAAETDENTLRKRGNFWEIRYQKKGIHLKDSVGLLYIATLLKESGHSMPASVLLAQRSGLDPRVVSGSSGEVVDSDAMKAYREQYADLEKELVDAEANHDDGKTEQIQTDMERLAAEVNTATGLGGRRRENSDVEKARKSVSMAIERSIKEITGLHPPLGNHFTAFISSGRLFRYAPEPPIDWVT